MFGGRISGNRVRHAVSAVLVLGVLAPTAAAAPGRSPAIAPERVTAGTFVEVYEVPTGLLAQWYINDHTFVYRDGTWHLFGITHPRPAAPEDEVLFAHATAPTLHGPWVKQPSALRADPVQDQHLWAPHIVFDNGTYYMFFATGGADRTQAAINLATSQDLYHWQRADEPLFTDGYEARDPMVTRVGDQWVMYYTATSEPTGGNHVVAYRTGSSLEKWSQTRSGVAFTDPTTGTGAGNTESPFVVRRGDLWYLFIGPRPAPQYTSTEVFFSPDPFDFAPSDKAGRIAAHAAEIIQDGADYWASSAGNDRTGVSIAPLTWSSDQRVAGN
ncbi:family 43 glycosylhydrolase [Nocardia sp. XZ_19_369]|uniref:family 43 glycosylhydrolase n=1 Tax=Nocardia sp. XZ_19_369 TaxID=2769487 RepID=UPI00188F888E|nr:family 43 glycosylhydrolase [Nocardia sp. XZ_19_369]